MSLAMSRRSASHAAGEARLASPKKLGGRVSAEAGSVDKICTVSPTVAPQPRAGCIRLGREFITAFNPETVHLGRP